MKIDNLNPAAVAREKALTLREVQRLLDHTARRCDLDTAALFGDLPDEVAHQLAIAEREARA